MYAVTKLPLTPFSRAFAYGPVRRLNRSLAFRIEPVEFESLACGSDGAGVVTEMLVHPGQRPQHLGAEAAQARRRLVGVARGGPSRLDAWNAVLVEVEGKVARLDRVRGIVWRQLATKATL